MKMKIIEKSKITEAIQCGKAFAVAKIKWKDLPVWLRDAYESGQLVFGDNFITVQIPNQKLLCAFDWYLAYCNGDFKVITQKELKKDYQILPESIIELISNENISYITLFSMFEEELVEQQIIYLENNEGGE